jgi:hypothetical protein
MGDQTQAYDIFQTPLSSCYPLPLRTFWRQSCVAFCINLRICDLRITRELNIWGFAVCGLARPQNLRTCNRRISSRICGLAVFSKS